MTNLRGYNKDLSEYLSDICNKQELNFATEKEMSASMLPQLGESKSPYDRVAYTVYRHAQASPAKDLLLGMAAQLAAIGRLDTVPVMDLAQGMQSKDKLKAKMCKAAVELERLVESGKIASSR